jgi:hypothetical protein
MLRTAMKIRTKVRGGAWGSNHNTNAKKVRAKIRRRPRGGVGVKTRVRTGYLTPDLKTTLI